MNQNDFLFESGRTQMNSEWKGTFNDYFSIAIKKPEVTYLAVQRIYHMIMSHGTSVNANGQTEYNFFKGKIFGSEKQIENIMMYLRAASMGLDIKKRVLLLLGPPGGGKSMILSLLKKELAAYTKTEKGAIYAIEGCPINEEPFHLLPEAERLELKQRYNIHVEGKLCPVCQFQFENDWKRNLNNVPVRRIYVNEDNRIGIGTFAPAERNDMSELYGSEDLSKIDYYGNSGDVRAYAFNGELHSANRGIMEFIEVLKAKPDFLHVLLTLAEEQQFKTPRFPLQYVDESLIAHTNEGEFQRFISVKEHEAIVDRLFIVRIPYNMEATDEEKIYLSALKNKLVVKGVSVHPGAVRLASKFAIMTRDHKDPLRKGMSGISPRFILNTLAISLVRSPKPQVSPVDMLQTLTDQVYNYPVLDLETRKQYLHYLKELKETYLPIAEQLDGSDVHLPKKPKRANAFDVMIGNEE